MVALSYAASRDHFLDEVAVNVGQPHVAATETVSKLLVIDAQEVQHRGVQIVHGAFVLDCFVAVLVGGDGHNSPPARRRRPSTC